MELTTEWYTYKNAIDSATCTKIIELANETFEVATIRDSDGKDIKESQSGVDPRKTRISDIAWSNDQWLIDLIWPYMLEANEQAGWNYDIRAVESIQITRYKEGNFYHFHRDGRSDSFSTYNNPENKFLHGHLRKLSMCIVLNDDYEEGDFQFSVLCANGGAATHTPPLTAGSIIVFPSFMMHRVTPVTKGTRYSLVAWFVGPPFK